MSEVEKLNQIVRKENRFCKKGKSGKKRYCLYVIKELQDEYNRSPRLKNAFSWVNDADSAEIGHRF